MNWGGEPAIQAVCNDITEVKNAEQGLKESEERFRDLAHAFGGRVWETDVAHRFTFISSQLSEGLPVETLLGIRRWEIEGVFPEDDGSMLRALT